MAYPIAWKGWGRYSNTGTRFRKWAFTEDVEALGARIGDELHDQGEKEKGKRFAVDARTRNGAWTWHTAKQVAEVVFDGQLPEWDPPSEVSGGGAGMSFAAETSLVEIANVLRRAVQAKTYAPDDDPKIPTQPRGVYLFPQAGRWDRDTLVAFSGKGEIVARRDLISDESPEEVAVFASFLQKELDRLDPIAPEPELSAVVESFLSDPAAAEVVYEPSGEGKLRSCGEWRALHRLYQFQKARPRACATCGEEYRPDNGNTRRCRTCIEEHKPKKRRSRG